MNHISLFSELLTFGMELQQPVEPVPDVELNEDWKEFETTLDEFKSEYVADRYNMYQKEIDYTVLKNDMDLLQIALKKIQDVTLKQDVQTCIDEYTARVELQGKKEELSLLSGKVKAMESVLMNTNASRHGQFTCPICMDRLVSIFLNPCGHLICDTCSIRLTDSKCPTCRVGVTKSRMYTAL